MRPISFITFPRNLPIQNTHQRSQKQIPAFGATQQPDRIQLRFSGQKRDDIPWPEVPDEMIAALRQPGHYQSFFTVQFKENPVDDKVPADMSRNDWILFNRIFVMEDWPNFLESYQLDQLVADPQFTPNEDRGYRWNDVETVALRQHVVSAIAVIRNDNLKSRWIDFMIRDPNDEVRSMAASQFETLSSQERIDAKAEELMMSPDPVIKAGCVSNLKSVSPRLRWNLLKETIEWQGKQPRNHRQLGQAYSEVVDSFFGITSRSTPEPALARQIRSWIRDSISADRVRHQLNIYQPSMQQEPGEPAPYGHKALANRHLDFVHRVYSNLDGISYNKDLVETVLTEIRQTAENPNAPARDLAKDVLLRRAFYQQLARMPEVQKGSAPWIHWVQAFKAIPAQASPAARAEFEKLYSSYAQYFDECETSEEARRDLRSRGSQPDYYEERSIPNPYAWTPEQIKAFEDGLPEH